MEVDTDPIAKTPQKSQFQNEDSLDKAAVGLRRIIIQDMVLENFKSYAGIQRIGPFHKSFSSIVGPNGSGKSNVIDAMLFVFGKRAKQLRLNKISELIHNSENHKFDFAKVSVQFVEIIDKDNEESELVPGSGLTISRAAYSNNDSKYYINEKASTFSEVTALLRSKGIDLDHNRFLILQGEVEQISLMKPKAQSAHEEGLLEYLEDIIGSNKYIEKIETESENLEKVNDRRCSVVHRFKIVEKEKQSIETGRNEAIEYLKTENEILNNESILLQVEDSLLAKEISTLESRLEKSAEKLNEEKEKTQSFRAELDQLEKEFAECSAEQKEIEKDMTSAKKSFEEFERRDVKVREELKQAKTKQKKSEDKISRETSKKTESMKSLGELTEQMTSTEKSIGKCEEKLRGEEAKLAEMQENIKDELSVFRDRMEGLKKELEPFETKLNVLEAENAEITDEKQELAKGKTSISDSLVQEKKECDALQKKLGDLTGDLDTRKKRSQELKAQLSKSKSSLKALQKEADATAEKAGKALGLLEEKKSSAKATAERSGVHSALMEAKRSGKIEGIIGRLGDLGTIDAKYDVAISTACSALNWIVVETTKAAQECVNFLRREKLGVSTFLILEKQNHLIQKINEDVVTPENIPRLFDLVKVSNQRYLPAFYFALGNTTVATTLEQASRIAYGSDQRFKRIVTVDGQLIESSGTMSGGGNKKARGGMRANFKDDDGEEESLRNAENSCTEIHRRKEELQHEVSQLEEKISKTESEYQTLCEDIPKLELERKNLQISLKKTKATIEVLTEKEKDCEKHAVQLASLNNKLDANVKETEKVKHTMKPYLQRYEKAKEEMDRVGGPEMARQRTLVQDLKSKLSDENSKLNKMKIDISKLKKSEEKCQKEIENCESQIETAKNEILRLEEELTSMEEKAASVLDSYTDLQNVYERKNKELESVRAKFDERKKNLAVVRKVELETKAHIDELSKTIAKHQAASAEVKRSVASKESKQLENLKEMVDDDDAEGAENMLPAQLSNEELESVTKEEVENANEELRVTLGMMKPDMSAIRAFKDKNADYMQVLQELETITKERDTIRRDYDALRKKRLEEFMAGFNSISLKLKEMYQMITLGGDAELELVDSLDPFTEGIVFSVRPPRKSWKNISNLSGGEKTLSSLALVFALHHYKPTPLYVMDEIDAALDFKNVSIVAHYIKERTRDAQFVIISLRNQMFELADRLVGIYKTNNATKSVTINPRQFGVPVEAS